MPIAEEQETPYYEDLDYEAILNADYGYRTEETIAQNAKDIAREHHLDEANVKEELDRINQSQKEQESKEEKLAKQKEQERNQEMEQAKEKESIIESSLEVKNENIQESLSVSLAIQELQEDIQQLEKEAQGREINKGNSPSPKEKIEIAQNTITEFNHNSPLVKEAVETELSRKAFQEEINELLIEKERRSNQEINSQSQENTAKPLNAVEEARGSNLQEKTEENKFANLSDEELQEKIKELEAKREQEEEHLKEIITQFEPKDIAVALISCNGG